MKVSNRRYFGFVTLESAALAITATTATAMGPAPAPTPQSAPTTQSASTVYTGVYKDTRPKTKALRAESMQFVTPGTVSIVGVEQCGDNDAHDFYLGNPTKTPPVAAHPQVDMITNSLPQVDKLPAVMGYWVVPYDSSVVTVPSQIPVPSQPGATTLTNGRWVPFAFGYIPMNVAGVGTQQSASQFMYHVNKSNASGGTPIATSTSTGAKGTGTIMREQFTELFTQIAPSSYTMPAATSTAGYNVYTALMVCKNYQATGGTANADNPESWEVGEGVLDLQSTLKSETVGHLASNWSGVKANYTVGNTPPLKLDIGGTVSTSGNALYKLGYDMHAAIGAGAPTAGQSAWVSSNQTTLLNIYKAFKPSGGKTDCASVPTVTTNENVRWFESYPMQFTCGQMDMANSTTGGSGFAADYAAIFNTSNGSPNFSFPTSGGDVAKVDRIAADLMAGGIMQVAQNLVHTQFVASAPTVSCFNASPYVNNLLQAYTIPMTTIGNKLGFKNPNPSNHPEGDFAITQYDKYYVSTTVNPKSGAGQGNTKAIFGMNTYDDGTGIDPIHGNSGTPPPLPAWFIPGVGPAGSGTAGAPPSVDPALEAQFGLLFNFFVRTIDVTGAGCGPITAPYCSIDPVLPLRHGSYN